MTRIWTVRELEGGFLVEVKSEVPGQRGVVSQFLERHAFLNIIDATTAIINDYKQLVKETKQ